MGLSHDDNCTCPGCLTWDDLDNAYIEFALEYSQQMVTYTLGVELLSDFPKNLPHDILVPIIAKRHEAISAVMKSNGIEPDYEHASENGFFEEAAKIKLTSEQHRIRCAYEGLYSLARFGKKMPEMEFPQFERFLVSQNIVVVCAFAEGFLSNALRILCEIFPNPFEQWSDKQSDKLKGMNESEMLDRYVFEITHGAFDKSLRRIENEFQFNIQASEDMRKKTSKLFLIRNCIVHNAGLVNKFYKQRCEGTDNLAIGDEVPLPETETEDLLDTLVDEVEAIYRSISIDLLKKPAEKLMYGAYRNLSQEAFEPK